MRETEGQRQRQKDRDRRTEIERQRQKDGNNKRQREQQNMIEQIENAIKEGGLFKINGDRLSKKVKSKRQKVNEINA